MRYNNNISTVKFHNYNYGYIMAFLLSCCFTFYSCHSEHKEQPEQQQTVVEPTPQYQAPYYPSAPYRVSETPTKISEKPAKTETQESVSLQQQPIKETKISRYYEEGYENGYDDGEDDAVMDNGWGGQYDDSCKLLCLHPQTQ